MTTTPDDPPDVPPALHAYPGTGPLPPSQRTAYLPGAQPLAATAAPAPARRAHPPWLLPAAALVTGLAVGTGAATAADRGAPQECRAALASADRLITLDDQGFDAAADALRAVSANDVDGINAQADRVRAITPQRQSARADYDQQARDCRDGR